MLLLLLAPGCREAPAPASRSSTTTGEQRCLVPCAEIEFGDRVADQIPPLDGPPALEAKSAAKLLTTLAGSPGMAGAAAITACPS